MVSLIDRWLPAERAAWKPTLRLVPSVWAERHRVLTRMQSARPGKWRNEQAPCLAGLMDLCADRNVEELTIVKAAQMGVSEAIRNVVGYYAHQEPDPILLVLPDEQTGRKIVAQRIVPLMRDTECLRSLFTAASRDIQLRHVTLANGFTLRLGWSGSPATLASDPCRVVVNDEVDKFQPWSGREADPISLGYARTQTYEGRRLIINISTPTTAEGLIWRRYQDAGVHLRFHVPCPHCGEFQALAFSNLRWPPAEGDPKKHAARLEQSDAVYYECAHCHQAINEDQKPAMIRAGVWVADGSTAGQPINLPRGSRVGVHLWAGYCLWIPWRRIAAEFIRSKDDAIALMAFTNGWLGEPFHQKIVHAKAHAFEEKCEGAAPPRVVPAWAQVLIATADTQKDHFYYVIRAWGPGYRSQRIDHGLVQTFDELRQVTLTNKYPCEDSRPPMPVKVLGIDSGGGISMGGSRTHEVYRFALSDPARIKALKGESRPSDAPIRTSKVTYTPPGKKSGPLTVFLTLMDSGHYKDRLAHAITNMLSGNDPKTGAAFEHEQWALNSVNDPDYNRQMSAEHKVLLRKPGGRQFECWQPISSGAANHYFDCEYQQFVMADMLRLELMPAVVSAPKQQAPARRVRSDRSRLMNRPPMRRHYDQYGGYPERAPGLRWRYE